MIGCYIALLVLKIFAAKYGKCSADNCKNYNFKPMYLIVKVTNWNNYYIKLKLLISTIHLSYKVLSKSNYTILNTRWKSDLYPFEKTTKFRFQSH